MIPPANRVTEQSESQRHGPAACLSAGRGI